MAKRQNQLKEEIDAVIDDLIRSDNNTGIYDITQGIAADEVRAMSIDVENIPFLTYDDFFDYIEGLSSKEIDDKSREDLEEDIHESQVLSPEEKAYLLGMIRKTFGKGGTP